MKQRQFQNRELADLVRNHGGILGAVEYGVTSTDIADPEIANAWRQIEMRYRQIRPSLSTVSRVLKKAA